jgi:hypothetical protein
MFIDLVQSLRCIESHEDTWLVAAVERLEGRHIIEGTLGCPLCQREYAVRGGVGWFLDRAPGEGGGPDGPPRVATEPAAPPAPDRAMRAAALLGLTDPGGFILLGGEWGDLAPALGEFSRAHFIVLDPPHTPPLAAELSVIRAGERLPLAAGALRAAAFDAAAASPARLDAAVRALRSGGRLVAPASHPLPNDVRELARDAADWVAERTPIGSAPISILSPRRR